MLRRMWSLSKSFLFFPGRAAEACADEENLAPCFWIYAAFTLGTMLFFALKPFDFPDQNAPYPREAQTLWFWFKVMLWQPPLEAAWIAFLLGLVAWFRQGSLPLRLVSAVAWTAVPFILMAVYAAAGKAEGCDKIALAAMTPECREKLVLAAREIRTAKWAMGLGALVWLGLFAPLWRRLSRTEVLPVVLFMLGVNAVGVLMLAPMSLAVLLRSKGLFMASQAAGGFWILGCATVGLRRLTGLRLPRVFMAVLLSMFFQIALAFTLHLLGVVPKDILKALLYA